MVIKISKISGLSEARGHHFYAANLNKNSIVVDLGSHLGEFSTEITKTFGCKSYAVEALPSLYEKIQESELLNKLNYAITDCEKEVSFCVSENPEGNYVNSAGNIANSFERIISVPGISLSRLIECKEIPSIDLLKVDIEGSEIDLFNSTSDELLKSIGQISIEFHDFKLDISKDVEIIVKRLNLLGFICVRYSFYTNGDVLFFNTNRLKINSSKLFYIQFLSRYFRGFQRAVKKILK
jgi:FkbM family methyltransferase